MQLRRVSIPALLFSLAVSAGRASAQNAGLDPAVDAQIKADVETIRRADASRKTAFLTRGTPQAERYQILQQFRDTRAKAALDVVRALVPVRASLPKDEWKERISRAAEQPAHPLLAEEALKALPAVVPDETRRKPAEKALRQFAAAARDAEDDRVAGRKKFVALLEKPTSTLQDFVTVLAKYDDEQAKLDDKLVAASDALQQALSEAEWQELVRRVSGP